MLGIRAVYAASGRKSNPKESTSRPPRSGSGLRGMGQAIRPIPAQTVLPVPMPFIAIHAMMSSHVARLQSGWGFARPEAMTDSAGRTREGGTGDGGSCYPVCFGFARANANAMVAV